MRTVVGQIETRTWYGLNPAEGSWGYPVREQWGFQPHQEMNPGLEDKLAFTVTATTSYREAAEVAQK